MAEKLKVLFLCTGNSCRSQMAEGWTRHLLGQVIEPYSAGIEIHGLNPLAVRVMAEAGVDISGHRSKHLDEFRDVALAAVVTVCDHAHEQCPLFPGTSGQPGTEFNSVPRDNKMFHVGFDDPPWLARKIATQGGTEEEQLDCYRRVRDEIRDFIKTLPAKLGV